MDKYVNAILVLFLLMVTNVTFANSDLYHVELHASASKQNDLSQALKMVLTRLSAGPYDDENPIFAQANPEHYIASIHTTNQSTHPLRHIRFKPSAINQLMHEGGVQPWIKTRPTIVTWVVEITRRTIQYKLVTQDAMPDVYQSLKQAATNKGLTLFFPDTNKIDGRPLEASYVPDYRVYTAAKLSESLHPEAVLLVIVNSNADDGDVGLEWQLTDLKNVGGDARIVVHPTKVGTIVMDGVSDFLFRQGERQSKPKTHVWVNIDGIKTVAAYDAVKEYIHHIPGVQHISLHSVTEDAVLYKLEMDIPLSLLEKRLSKKYSVRPAQREENIINYRFKA